ncbi:MAG: HAD-IIA family hydrolase [Haloechinothrix sp.]
MSFPSLLDVYDALLLDLDGTVYHGSRAVDGAAEAVHAARQAGVRVRFVTNNASKTPGLVAEHLSGLGVPAAPSEVATSAQAGATMLAARVPAGSLVLVVGTESLAAEVAAVGLRVARTASADVAAVVQGHSPDTCWSDLAEACAAIRAGAAWVACNVDPTLPTERGQLPGNGSMVAALRAATGAAPDVAGKPAPGLFAAAEHDAGARRALVVGDRLDTDIAGARAAGLDSLLVLSGVTTPAELLAAPREQRPTYLAADMSAVAEPAEVFEIGAASAWQVTVGDGALFVSVRDSGAQPLGLLSALCAQAWTSGRTMVRPVDEEARRAAAALHLIRYG